MANAAATSTPAVALWLLDNRSHTCEKHVQEAFASAAQRGELELLKKLITSRREELTTQTMDTALIYRQWETIHYLHEHSPVGCSTAAMDEAAARGYLDVVQFLHDNCLEACATNAMDIAARGGHSEVVLFLHHNRKEGCTAMAMEYAATNGHLNIVRFLHANRTEGCSEEALAGAARKGHLDVVKFLHGQHGLRAPARFAVWSVFPRGNMELEKFLHEVVDIPFDNSALSNAKATRDKELVAYVTGRMRSSMLGMGKQ